MTLTICMSLAVGIVIGFLVRGQFHAQLRQ